MTAEELSVALNEAESERNLLALAYARLAKQLGWTIGRLIDSDESGWSVLMVDTPQGQVSFNMPRGEVPNDIPLYPGRWDGHDTPEKWRRLGLVR